MKPLHILFDGISGAGKDTQIAFAAQYLRSYGFEPHVIAEPSAKVKELITAYKRTTPEHMRDARWELQQFIDDRKEQTTTQVLPLLREENAAVLKNRSYLSTCASQARDGVTVDDIIRMHAFYPPHDLALIFVCEPETAVLRATLREQGGGMVKSADEYAEKIAKTKAAYESIVPLVPNTHLVRADGSVNAVRQQVRCYLDELLGVPMRKAVFLDKDGTLVDNSGYPEVIPADKIFFDKTVEGLRAFQNAGYKLIIHSSQPWVARGRMSEDEVKRVFESVVAQYAAVGVTIDHYGYCVHGRKGEPIADGSLCDFDCPDKKPNTGLLETATDLHNIDIRKSIMIGDSDVDIVAGRDFGLKTVLVRTGNGLSYDGAIAPDHVADDVDAAAKILLR